MNAASNEDRRWITHSERLEMSQQALELCVGSGDGNLEVDSYLGYQLLGSEHRVSNFVEPANEIRYSLTLDGYACRRFVATIAEQEVTAFT